MINAGIAGLGWWGQVLVDSVQDGSTALRFTAAATRSRSDKAKRYCDRQGIALHNGFDDLLNDPALDAIVLATPHSQHREQIVAAAQAGKHVFAEKPLTLTRDDAAAAVAAMREAGKVLGLGYQRRFHPAMVALRNRVQAGDLGTVLQITCTLGAPLNLTLGNDHWRAESSEAPAGALTPLGVHAIDAIIDLLGEVETVYCASARRGVSLESDDTTSLILHLKSGAVAQVAAMVATGLNYRLTVFGTKGWEAISGYPEFTGHEFQPVGHPLQSTPLEPFNMIRAELEAFAEAISGSAPFPITPDQMVHAVAVLEAAVRSTRSHLPEAVV